MDLGIHLVDAALWILGSPITRVENRLFYRARESRDVGTMTVSTSFGSVTREGRNGSLLVTITRGFPLEP